MEQRTPLYDSHLAAGARMVEFAGWQLPLHYGSQVDEHHAVRRDAGMFDVSHMTVVDFAGDEAEAFLRGLLANDVRRLRAPGKALYSLMLNEDGGVLDDLIVYFLEPGRYRAVLNAATRDKDLAWIDARREGMDVGVTVRDDRAMIAVQGPRARERAAACLPSSLSRRVRDLERFQSTSEGDLFVARTGYTGEDGVEMLLPVEDAASLWSKLDEAGVAAAGLGARDTLRLEAGMHLYGNDLDENVTPLESGLGWTVAFDPADRQFVGRGALESRHERDDLRRFVGLLLEDRGVLRGRERVVVEGREDGVTTSGGYSPTLERSIALARLPAGDETRASVEQRSRLLDARIVSLPFVRNGAALVDL